MSTLGLASLTPSECAGFAGWLRDALALICLVGICAAMYLAGAGVVSTLGLASLTPSERAGFAGWLRDALALICLVGICAALYFAGGL